MGKKTTKNETGKSVDEKLDELYTLAKDDFQQKLQIVKEMVKLEMARLRSAEESGETPSFYSEEDPPNG